jgi:endoglucanase
MKTNTKYLFLIFFLTLVQFIFASPTTTSPLIKIDQFGYRTIDQKIAIISIPQVGYNAPSTFTPGTVYQVRNWTTDAIVFSGSPVAWSFNTATLHAQSGDKAFWFDFSSLTTVGSYYIFDVTNNVGSYRFEINDNVYIEALKQATRMFYYQRCGVAKLAAHAQSAWADGVCHKGVNQDTDCRLYNNTAASTSKDLSGGWHDAGDYNKYVNFAYLPMVNLLMAYKESPTVWTDDFNIPESGNGIPDILDEAKVELDWLLKMQNTDGSIISVMGVTSGGAASPPSADAGARRYAPATTSATFSGAAIFALAAIQFKSIGQTSYANTLQTAAINAYNWGVANPAIIFNNVDPVTKASIIAAGEQEVDSYERGSRKFVAAVFLYALTNTASYKTYIDANYNNIHLMSWGTAYPFETVVQDATLYYAFLSGATTTVSNAIKNTYSNSLSTKDADNLQSFLFSLDAYRSYVKDANWTWNSNQTKSSQANMFLNMNYYNLDATNATNYTNAASGFVHYFHGVNPNGKTFLSNMSAYGAENSVTSFYHGWFADKSALWDEVGVSTYGPPPGFMPGGPNPSYKKDACCPSGCGSPANNALCSTNVTPPLAQPIQKSYKDFNDGWPLNSWEITEPAIYTNATYLRMLSRFIGNGALGVTENEIIANKIIVYPSPSKSIVNISFAGIEEDRFTLNIVDLSGKIVMNKKIKLQSNSRIQTLDISNLSSGLYWFKIQGSDFAITKRVVKE